MKLTKRVVDALHLEPGETSRRVYDDALAGFGLRLTKDRKTYFIRFRVGTGRDAQQRMVNVGVHGEVTPDEARDAARAIQVNARAGVDTVSERQAELIEAREGVTLADFSIIYLERHARAHKRPKSVEQDELLFRRWLLPAFGKLRMRDLTRGQVQAWFSSAFGTRRTTANRALALLSVCYSRAEAWDFLPPAHPSPTRKIERFRETRKQDELSLSEVAAIGQAIEAMRAEGEEAEASARPFRRSQFQQLDVLQLLFLTGARVQEVLALQWAEVQILDRERGVIELPEERSKTGARAIGLGPAAIAIILRQGRVADNQHVFSGFREGQPLDQSALRRTWLDVQARAGIAKPRRLHDIRHTFASARLSEGDSLAEIGASLGHQRPETTARYARLAHAAAFKAALAAEERMAARMKPTPAPDSPSPERPTTKGLVIEIQGDGIPKRRHKLA